MNYYRMKYMREKGFERIKKNWQRSAPQKQHSNDCHHGTKRKTPEEIYKRLGI